MGNWFPEEGNIGDTFQMVMQPVSGENRLQDFELTYKNFEITKTWNQGNMGR